MATVMPSVELSWGALAVAVASTVILYHVINFFRDAVWEPLRLRSVMAKQGIRGPPFRFLLGHVMDTVKFAKSFPDNLPMDDFANLSPTVTPQYAMYFPKYGKVFLYWVGKTTRLVLRDPEIVKELMITNYDFLKRARISEKMTSLVMGKGMLMQYGEKWTIERRTATPFFHQDALKAMVEAMVEGAATEINRWEKIVAERGGEAEIDVEPDLHRISGRIISKTAFGDDFEKGEEIFKFLTLISQELMKSLRSLQYWLVPGYSKLPTKGKRLMDLYGSKVDALLRSIIDGRREAFQKGKIRSYGNDLLGRMLAAASEGWDEKTTEFNCASVFHNCKLFYFAGQDTVANATTFALLMLALYPEWQDRARKEVLEVFGDEHNCNPAAISHLKVVGMVFNETLRLFPPAAALTRVITKDLQLKELFVPKGIMVEIPLLAIHQDRDYWGDDVGEFNPERFAKGVAEACTHRQAFIPFGLGPRFCIGNNFAVQEAKLVLAMVLRRFQILPSPNYKHHPTIVLIQKPKFGLPIILKTL